MPTPLIPDMAVFESKLAILPLMTYQARETVLSAASTTGRLLILKEGAVAVVKEGVEIARVTEPGNVPWAAEVGVFAQYWWFTAAILLRRFAHDRVGARPAPYSANSPCCWISRTPPMYVRLKPRTFMSPMRPPYLG
jgi:hypothetical protein